MYALFYNFLFYVKLYTHACPHNIAHTKCVQVYFLNTNLYFINFIAFYWLKPIMLIHKRYNTSALRVIKKIKLLVEFTVSIYECCHNRQTLSAAFIK